MGQSRLAAKVENPRGALIWIHGPQPVLSYSLEMFYQRRDHDIRKPVFYDVPVTKGPNVYLEKFQDLFKPEVLLWEGASRGSLADRLTELVSPSYSHNQVIFSTETVKKGTERAPLWTRETVARLWAAQEIGRDLGSDKRDRVELLTRTYSILHRDSAAVALETTPKWDAGQDPEWIGRAAFERRSGLMPMVRNSALVAISEPLTRRGSAMDRLKSVSLESSWEVRSKTEGFELGSLASKASGFGSQRKSIVVVFRPWLILLLFLTPLVVAVLYFRSRRRVIRPVFRLSDQ